MNTPLYSLIVAAFLLTACTVPQNGDQTSSASSESSVSPVSSSPFTQDIHPALPAAGALVTSPLLVTGEARGSWYFEASFPVKLLDAHGNTLVQWYAQAQGEWMTTDFVLYESTLIFPQPTTATGTLVLEKDNPSGLPEHAASVTVPVRFE